MAKIRIRIGFALQVKNPDYPSVFEEQLVERPYYAELMRDFSVNWQPADKAIDDINLKHEISILADSFANKNGAYMRYAVIKGIKWKIESIEIPYPRIILSIGGVYNSEE